MSGSLYSTQFLYYYVLVIRGQYAIAVTWSDGSASGGAVFQGDPGIRYGSLIYHPKAYTT
jgi:hypothetical protein